MNKSLTSICIFGDSTAWGAWDKENCGWVNRLALEVSKQAPNIEELNTFIYNLSIAGGTTETILERFGNEAKVREADALIFQSGGNDSYLIGKNGKNFISIEKFEKNLEKIIERGKKITENIIFLGFEIVDESKSAPVSWEDIYYINEEIQKYNKVLKEVCERNNILYLDTYGLLTKEDLIDGVHPNSKGHEKLFIKVKGFLEEKEWI